MERIVNARVKFADLRKQWNTNTQQYKFFYNYQSIYIIYAYLFLKYPDKYFVYQSTMFNYANNLLNSSYEFSERAADVNVKNCHLFMQELHDNIVKDD